MQPTLVNGQRSFDAISKSGSVSIATHGWSRLGRPVHPCRPPDVTKDNNSTQPAYTRLNVTCNTFEIAKMPADEKQPALPLAASWKRLILKDFKRLKLPWVVFVVMLLVYLLILFFAVGSQLFPLTLDMRDTYYLQQYDTFYFSSDYTYLQIELRPTYRYNLIYIGLQDPVTQQLLYNQSLGYMDTSQSDGKLSVHTLLPSHPGEQGCFSFKDGRLPAQDYTIILFYDNNLHLDYKCNDMPTSIRSRKVGVKDTYSLH